MRAVVLNSGQAKFQADYPLPSPLPGEVLVQVLQAGICETDLQLLHGYMEFAGVLGHEFVGRAEDGPLAGERVVGEINCSCRRCEYCRNGLANHCPTRTVIGILNHDGAFADYLAVPSRNLHWVPPEVSTEEAVFTEPLAAAFQIPARITLDRQTRVVVLGDGRLGHLCAQVIQLSGCQLTVVGKHSSKLELLDRLEINTCLLDDYRPTRDADVVVDCTGSPDGLPLAFQVVKPRGTIVMKTTVAGRQTLALAPIVIDEIRLIGSRCGPFADALEALKSKVIDVRPLISKRYELHDIETALQQAGTAPNFKVLLNIAAEA